MARTTKGRTATKPGAAKKHKPAAKPAEPAPRAKPAEAKHCADPAGDPHIRLQILSQPRYLCGAREMVAAVAKRIGFSDLNCSQIALAIDEALANVMRHGYSDRPDGPIWLSVWPLATCAAKSDCGCSHEDVQSNGEAPPSAKGGPMGLRIVIEDEARQIDPATIKGRDLEDIRPGGLGVHIIRHVMDSVDYEKRDGKGMRLTLEKRL